MEYDISLGRHGVSLSVAKGQGLPPEEHFAKPKEEAAPKLVSPEDIERARVALQCIRKRHRNFAVSRIGLPLGKTAAFGTEVLRRKRLERSLLKDIAGLFGLTTEEFLEVPERHSKFKERIAKAIIKNDLATHKKPNPARSR